MTLTVTYPHAQHDPPDQENFLVGSGSHHDGSHGENHCGTDDRLLTSKSRESYYIVNMLNMTIIILSYYYLTCL